MSDHVYLYDTTLRDGAQTRDVDFSVADKQAIARELDLLGIDFIEGGWPGANPTDDAFFDALPHLQQSQMVAFGMTRRAGHSAANDPGLNAVLNAATPAVCIVGKTWDFHVTDALGLSLDDNLAMIHDSINHAVSLGKTVFFDAEHAFDGLAANPDYAHQCLQAAYKAGARWIVLCDTNGGTLPHDIRRMVSAVARDIPGEYLAIHCHNDTENAVANSLAAVEAGARLIQGTMNGLGERCGNANLTSIIPCLMLKMGYQTSIKPEQLQRLTHVSRLLDDRLNRPSNRHAAFVGESAFAHKGGLHVSAVLKNPKSYEHIDPASIGNRRHILVSDQSGRASVLSRLQDIGLSVDPQDPRINDLVDLVKQREFAGYAYDGAAASFALLARQTLFNLPEFYTLTGFRVIDERRWNAKGALVTLSEATVKVRIQGQEHMAVAEGNGPVNALDAALRQVLLPIYPALSHMQLVDYKVRILNSGEGTKALTRVLIESRDHDGNSWSTIGVSANVIDASYNALQDAIVYLLSR